MIRQASPREEKPRRKCNDISHLRRIAQPSGQRGERPGNQAFDPCFRGFFHRFFRTGCGRLHGSLLSHGTRTNPAHRGRARYRRGFAVQPGKEGFDVELAHRGDSGLEALRRQAPDLILLDLMLPGVDGLELTRLLKRDAGTARIPIVMLTARGEEVTASSAWSWGPTTTSASRSAPARSCCGSRRCCAGSSPRRPSATAGCRRDPARHLAAPAPGARQGDAADRDRIPAAPPADGAGRTGADARPAPLGRLGYAEDIDSRTVDTHIRRLRRKLGPEADRIETVIGVGYRLRP